MVPVLEAFSFCLSFKVVSQIAQVVLELVIQPGTMIFMDDLNGCPPTPLLQAAGVASQYQFPQIQLPLLLSTTLGIIFRPLVMSLSYLTANIF